MHDGLAAPLSSPRLRANLAERLWILQVHRRRWTEESPRLHEILKVPTNLELEALIDVDVLLRRDLAHNQRYSRNDVAPQIAGRERGWITEVADVNDRVDPGRAEPVGSHVPVVVAQLRMRTQRIGASGAYESWVVVKRTGGEVEVERISAIERLNPRNRIAAENAVPHSAAIE